MAARQSRLGFRVVARTSEERRAAVDQLFALREPTWLGCYDSGAIGGPKRVGDGAFYATGSVDLCQPPLEESRSVTDRSVLL